MYNITINEKLFNLDKKLIIYKVNMATSIYNQGIYFENSYDKHSETWWSITFQETIGR